MSAVALLRKRTVGPLVGTQLFTALGDNALLVAAIALLEKRGAAGWMSPALRICLYLSYVLLAPLAGGLADALPKGRLIVLVNLVKLGGCVLLAIGVHPLAAFSAIGLAGVCHGPAKYGILAELVSNEDLVPANAWIEVATVSAILGGTALGAALLQAPLFLGGLDTAIHQAGLLPGALFGIAACWACAIPATACSRVRKSSGMAGFRRQLAILWRDPQGRVSLAVTALFWAVAAVLQFLVIRWAETVLHLSLGEAAMLQCCMAVGVIAGSLGVVRFVSAHTAMRVMPGGVVLGVSIILVSQVTDLRLACLALGAIGVMAGIVMVPMNALLQQRGNALMRPGVSVAVQGFSENLASLVFLVVYGMLLTLAVPVGVTIVGFGLLVTALMLLIQRHVPPACPGAIHAGH